VWYIDEKKEQRAGIIADIWQNGKEYQIKTYTDDVRCLPPSVPTYQCTVLCLLVPNPQLVTIKAADVRNMHKSSKEGVEDMIQLSELHESSLLHNLRKRFLEQKIYVCLPLWSTGSP